MAGDHEPFQVWIIVYCLFFRKSTFTPIFHFAPKNTSTNMQDISSNKSRKSCLREKKTGKKTPCISCQWVCARSLMFWLYFRIVTTYTHWTHRHSAMFCHHNSIREQFDMFLCFKRRDTLFQRVYYVLFVRHNTQCPQIHIKLTQFEDNDVFSFRNQWDKKEILAKTETKIIFFTLFYSLLKNCSTSASNFQGKLCILSWNGKVWCKSGGHCVLCDKKYPNASSKKIVNL